MNEGHDTASGFTPLFNDRGGVGFSTTKSIGSARLSLEPTPQGVKDDIINGTEIGDANFYKRGKDDYPHSAGFHHAAEGHLSPPRGETNAHQSSLIAPPKTAQFANPEEMATIQNLILQTAQEETMSPTAGSGPKTYVSALLASPQGNLDSKLPANGDMSVDSTTKKAKDAVAQAAAAALLAVEGSDEEGSSSEEEASEDSSDDNDDGSVGRRDGAPEGQISGSADQAQVHQHTPAQATNPSVPRSLMGNKVHSVDAARRNLDISPDCMSTSMFEDGTFMYSDELAALSPQMTPHSQHGMQQVLRNSIPTPQVKAFSPNHHDRNARDVEENLALSNNSSEQEAADLGSGEGIPGQHHITEAYNISLATEEQPSNDARETYSQGMEEYTRSKSKEGGDDPLPGSPQVLVASPKQPSEKISERITAGSNNEGTEFPLGDAPTEPKKSEKQERDRQTTNGDKYKETDDSTTSDGETTSTRELQSTSKTEKKSVLTNKAKLVLPAAGGKQARVNRKTSRKSLQGKPLDKENDLPGRNTRRGRSLPTRKKKIHVEETNTNTQQHEATSSDSATRRRVSPRRKALFGASNGNTNTTVEPENSGDTGATEAQKGEVCVAEVEHGTTEDSNCGVRKLDYSKPEKSKEDPVKKKRGRPRKVDGNQAQNGKAEKTNKEPVKNEQEKTNEEPVREKPENANKEPVKKKRGRPRKVLSDGPQNSKPKQTKKDPTKKKQGRPPKKKQPLQSSEPHTGKPTKKKVGRPRKDSLDNLQQNEKKGKRSKVKPGEAKAASAGPRQSTLEANDPTTKCSNDEGNRVSMFREAADPKVSSTSFQPSLEENTTQDKIVVRRSAMGDLRHGGEQSANSAPILRPFASAPELPPAANFASPTDSETAENKALEAANKLLCADLVPPIRLPNTCGPPREVVTPLSKSLEVDESLPHDPDPLNDPELGRTVNPLLGYKIEIEPGERDPADDEPPHVLDVLQLSELSCPKPDTFPPAFYARLLGYEVPVLKTPGSGPLSGKADQAMFSFPEDDNAHVIPPGGSIYSAWDQQERSVTPEAEQCKDALFKSFIKDAWDKDCLHPFSPHNVKMHINSFIKQATECNVLGFINWQVEAMDADEEQTWTFLACNKLKPDTEYCLSFCFEHYAVVPDDATFDTQTIEDSPAVVSVHFANLERDLLFENDGISSNPVLLLLFGLIVEVGRSCKAKYCLLELNPSLAKILQSHFCVVRVENGGRVLGSSSEREKWVCDLCRSSLNDALRKTVSLGDRTCTQRLLVALPTAEETGTTPDRRKSGRLVKVPTGETGTPPDRRKFDPLRKCSPGDRSTQHFTSATGCSRRYFVGLRAKRGLQSSAGMDLCLIDRDGQEGMPIRSTECASSALEWEVLKSFPHHKLSRKNQPTPFNGVLEKLKKKQQELKAIENEVLKPKVKHLLEEVLKERTEFDCPERVAHRKKTLQVMEEYGRRFSSRDIGRTWQQLEDDMEAVCVVCNEGEVTPRNWIVICDGCEEPLHQSCYGIEEVPKGKYYCQPCQAKRDGVLLKDPVCELCPLSGGAFLKAESTSKANGPKWVHVVCAKWQNLAKVDPLTYEDPRDITEDFRMRDISCCLCEGTRGAFSQCQHKRCKKFMHVTCARYSEVCELKRGDPGTDAEENIIFCPKHSTRYDDESMEQRVPVTSPIQELVQIAKSFPPSPTPFPKQTRADQRQSLRDPDNEKDFLCRLANNLSGAKCDACSGLYEWELAQCEGCKSRICAVCTELSENGRLDLCAGCRNKRANSGKGCTPQCSVCYQKGGWLRKATAQPTPKQVQWFKKNPNALAESVFKKVLWCHAVCSRVNVDKTRQDTEDGFVDLSKTILGNGREFQKPKRVCSLCGNNGGLKQKCKRKGCRSGIGAGRGAHHFHATCAWQAGLSVCRENYSSKEYQVGCLEHSNTTHNLRAWIEDLIEVEESRIAKRGDWGEVPMTYDEAAKILNHAIGIMRTLGWAWRWEEWWVRTNFNWEPYIPFLKEGQSEDDFTDEEKRIVASTPKSRQSDAEKCSLASFGAALRNRNYDVVDEFDNKSLHNALRAILSTKSLVGPLKDFEIEFLEEWLGRAYRSKSPHLCFGDDKIDIGDAKFCYRNGTSSPAYQLDGELPLPGRDSSDSVVNVEHADNRIGHVSPLRNASQRAVGSCAIDNGGGRAIELTSHEVANDNQVSGLKIPAPSSAEEANLPGVSSELNFNAGKMANGKHDNSGSQAKHNVDTTECPSVDTSTSRSIAPAEETQKHVSIGSEPDVELSQGHKLLVGHNTEGDHDSATCTERSLVKGGHMRISLELETKNKRAKMLKELESSKPNAKQSPVAPSASGEIANHRVIASTPNQTKPVNAEKQADVGSSKRYRRSLTFAEDTIEARPCKVAKGELKKSSSKLATKPDTCSALTNGSQKCASVYEKHASVVCNLPENKKQPSKKRPYHSLDNGTNKKLNQAEMHPPSDDEETNSESEDDSSVEGSIESIKTIRTKQTADDATYKEALKKLKLRSPSKKDKPRNRMSQITAETAKLTAPSPMPTKSASTVDSPGGKSFKSYRSGMSRRLRPTKPAARGVQLKLPKSPIAAPPKVGIKGSSIQEDEIEEDDGSVLDDNATLAGQMLQFPTTCDEVSVITQQTDFARCTMVAQQDWEEEDRSRNSYGSDADSITKAIKRAQTDGFPNCQDLEFPTHLLRDNPCRHRPIWVGARRGNCVVCSKTALKTKTAFGCSECLLIAFEHKYGLVIDRNKIPDYFKHKEVFLCVKEEEPSCCDIWHARDSADSGDQI